MLPCKVKNVSHTEKYRKVTLHVKNRFLHATYLRVYLEASFFFFCICTVGVTREATDISYGGLASQIGCLVIVRQLSHMGIVGSIPGHDNL